MEILIWYEIGVIIKLWLRVFFPLFLKSVFNVVLSASTTKKRQVDSLKILFDRLLVVLTKVMCFNNENLCLQCPKTFLMLELICMSYHLNIHIVFRCVIWFDFLFVFHNEGQKKNLFSIFIPYWTLTSSPSLPSAFLARKFSTLLYLVKGFRNFFAFSFFRTFSPMGLLIVSTRCFPHFYRFFLVVKNSLNLK